MRTSKGELYARAYNLEPEWRKHKPQEPAELRACEVIYLHGMCDAQSGDVDAPTGYFYRIDRWIVVTDQQGFHHLITHESEDEASKAFGVLDDEYGDWDNAYIEL